MESSSGWFGGANLLAKIVREVFKRPISVSPQTGWCSTCFASKCRCSSTSRGEDQSHHGARGNHKGKLQGGFSGVQETSFNIQSCSYQAGRGHHQPTFQVGAGILFGHQNDIAAMLESDKRQK